MTFDVDSHVEESAQTWKYLDEKFSRRRPIAVTLEEQPALLGQNAFWLIDGAVVPRTSGKGLSLFGTPTTSRHAREKPFTIGSQELTDIEARIRDLDKFGIDTQIVNSTLLNATLLSVWAHIGRIKQMQMPDREATYERRIKTQGIPRCR